MTDVHPNLAVLSKLDLRDLDTSAALLADDFVWHYFNPNLPDLEGDFLGVEGLKDFFGTLGADTKGTFNVEPVSTMPIGDEFVVVHVRDKMEHAGRQIALDAVVVWRIIDGKLAEAWDIPATHTVKISRGGVGAQT